MAPALGPEWREIAPWYGAAATARILGGFLLVVALTPWAVLLVSPWTLALLAPLLGLFAYQLTILIHDCSHRNLFRSATLNRVVGEAASGVLGTDFRQYTRIHWQHHQRLGEVEDPQRPDYVGLRQASPGRIAWHLVRPLLGYNVVFKLVQYNIGKMLRASGGKAAEGEMTRPHLLPIVGAQAAIAVLITGFGQLWWLVFLYPACAGTIGLFLSQVRGFAEHVAPADAASETYVRSHLPGALGAVFFPLNFNYHLEHHLYPYVPSSQLPRLHGVLAPEHHTADTLSPGILSTIRHRLKQARDRHGEGMATAARNAE